MAGMSEGYKPREHDHLVEPMYKALHNRGPSDPGDVPAARSRRDRAALWILPVLALLAWGLFKVLQS